MQGRRGGVAVLQSLQPLIRMSKAQAARYRERTLFAPSPDPPTHSHTRLTMAPAEEHELVVTACWDGLFHR